MIPPLVPGRRFRTTLGATTGGPLDLSGTLAASIASQIGESARLARATVEAEPPTKGNADNKCTASGVVTAVTADQDSSLRVEVAARISDGPGGSAILQLVFTLDTEAEEHPSGLLCPGSHEWQTELHHRLDPDIEFARLIEAYDGTIGLAIGGRPVHIRCYRGRVIEVAARSLRGADFILNIPGDVFIDLVIADQNVFMQTVMRGAMKSTGSGYEYLRMTSALIRIIDHARDIARTAGYAGTQTAPKAHQDSTEVA